MYNPYTPSYNPSYSPQNTYQAVYLGQSQHPQQLTRVTGIEGARAYQMPPNSVAPLFDANRDVLYVKSTDGAGFPTIRAFTFTELVDDAPATPDYVTRTEFEQLKELVTNGQQLVPTTDPAAQPARASKKQKPATTV
jgi:hypothetical protein